MTSPLNFIKIYQFVQKLLDGDRQTDRQTGDLISLTFREKESGLKMTAFWDIAPRSLVKVDRFFRSAYCFHHQGDGGSKHLWNVGELLRDYTAQYSRRLSS
jgi:hypothetical protein